MLRKFLTTGMAVSAINIAFSQDSTKAPVLSVTGSADVYYKYDFGKTPANGHTSFTSAQHSFALGMASVKLEHKTDKVDMVADLGFGQRAKDFSYNDKGVTAAIKQLYISYMPVNWLKLTAGSWATHVGYEVVDPYANRNYSMSYMFSYGPFFHTGVKAEVAYHNSGLMLGVANPTDFKYVPAGVLNKKFVIAQYSFTPGDYFKAYINYVGGQNIDTSKSHQWDVVLTSKISDKFSIAYNGTVNSSKTPVAKDQFSTSRQWWGSALYLNYDASKKIGFTLRNEYFSDRNGLKLYYDQPYGGSVFATTLSADIKVDHLLFIPEVRVDHANQNLFTKGNGNPAQTDAFFLLAAIYQF